MTRLEELKELFKDASDAEKKVIYPLLEEAAFLEGRLKELKKLPMIRVHPKNPARQEVTPAGKQYRDTMGTYVNVVKVLERAIRVNAAGAESPLAKMLQEFESDDYLS